MNIRKLLTAAVVATLGLAPAAMAQTEIKFGHVGEPGSLMDLSATEFAKRANEKLGDKARVVVYGSSQLGNDKAMMQKLKLGTIDLSLPSTIMSSTVPIFGLFEMPYLIHDREHMARVRDEVVMPEMAPQAEAAGYRIVAVWENGFRQITNNARPITKPEDLKGIKLRVPAGEWRMKMFESYGASPSPLALSEVFVALQTGVMDGQENPYAQIYPSRFYEVQKYLSVSNHVYTPAYVTAGRSWSKFDPEVQAALRETAVEMQDVVYDIAARLDTELHQKLIDAGMVENEVDTAAFIEASKPIYAEFSKSVDGGGALIEKVQGLVTQ
ncbi:TRAP transporter substrate-binding protein [Amaricoccus solimangrovi]|uniref:TRAP transporter substrate-binding protein n=1 Tax=Amaricoccus solimangrovi TaxID=2589815 RepID=A0A501WYT9_9RHOB|nr:TRAP transporter substrate-binding protein [Amaricoccus solimangrovi]TPE53485.1 TRAP transporter substrate-binding protein [Amaricoccus solimangrovi]